MSEWGSTRLAAPPAVGRPAPLRVFAAAALMVGVGGSVAALTAASAHHHPLRGRGATAPGASAARAAGSALPRASAAMAAPRDERAHRTVRLPVPARWLAFGGGAEPASNQVSLEQDLLLARAMLGPGGAVLFAGGAGRAPVQVLVAQRGEVDLRAKLGWLFNPRDGRRAHYRPARLEPDGPATPVAVDQALRAALAQPGQEPLLVFVAAHGEPGKSPRDNLLRLWGGGALSVADVDRLWRAVAVPRPLRLVVTSCFAGGFAELAFAGADVERGAPGGDRCGLFASRWDTEASGCDPNPDRRQQQSYGLHFLHALAGQDRQGKPIAAELDLDGDGRISLYEAHTRVRIASRSFSQPTSTSERWLRVHAPASGPARRFALVEEQALIDRLGRVLHLADAAAARVRLRQLDARADALAAQLERREKKVDGAFAALRIALLERWPVLDDPYHPDYRRTLERDGAAISRFIERARSARAFRRHDDVAARLQDELDRLELDAALAARLVRAHQTLALAARLQARGGPAWQHYLRLLACERTVPERSGSR